MNTKTVAKRTVDFFHEFNPPTATAQQRRHTRTGKTYQPEKVKLAAATLQAIFERHAPPEPFRGPVRLQLAWTYPHPKKTAGMGVSCKTTRPDLDNLAKLALDAMTAAKYWEDDAQVVDFHTCKYHGDLPGIAVIVDEVAP